MTTVCGWCRLGLKLLAATLTIEIVMLALLLTSAGTISNSRLESLFRQRLVEVEKLLNASLSGPLAAQDLATLQDVLEALRDPQAISYLVLVDRRGRRVAASGWPDDTPLPAGDQTMDAGGRFDVALPIALAGARYGTLHYGVETTLLAEAQYTLLTKGAVIAGLAILLSAMALTLVSILLTRRLVRLSEAAEAIAAGNLTARVPTVGGGDEVDRLATSFNAMADALDLRMRALAVSEEKFSKAFAASPDALMISGADGAILEVNAAFERFFGMSRGEALGRRLASLCEGECGRRLTEIIGRAATRDAIEIALPRCDGETSICLVSADGIDLSGQPCRIAILHDITERKSVEEALARSNHDLEQFAYVASHDLREPLRMVSAYVGLLDRRYGPQLDADARQFITFAKDGAERLDRLILDLLEYSRLTRGDKPFATLDLAGPMQTALHNLRLAIGEAGATIDIGEPLPRVAGDPGLLARLFQNLIGNALKYRAADRPPHVTVAAVREGGQWRISVADNGIGIEPAYYERVFQLFQRLHGRGAYPGTGIGLAVCKRIVERHHGHIWVESQPDQGCTFHFTLPALPGDDG